MATQLNIKDPEAVRLARVLAKRTGRTVTETVRDALTQADIASTRNDAQRLEQFLTGLHDIPAARPNELEDKTSRQIVKDFHEEEWREQFGQDQWS